MLPGIGFFCSTFFLLFKIFIGLKQHIQRSVQIYAFERNKKSICDFWICFCAGNQIEGGKSSDECNESKIECEGDVDDGFSKSVDDCSFHSANETFSNSKSSASSTSGVVSTISSQQSTAAATLEHNTEIVQKIHVSREVNDAIFKPGTFFLAFFVFLLCHKSITFLYNK